MLLPSPDPQPSSLRPACLDKPDLAGCVRSRATATEVRYREGYARLERRARDAWGRQVTIFDVATYVSAYAINLQPRSYRQYRAHVLQQARDLFDRGELDEAEAELISIALDGGAGSLPETDLPVRCGHRRAKSLSKEEWRRLIEGAERIDSRVARQLAMVLLLGPVVGIRPYEWPSVRREGAALVVDCAKFSVANGRGVAETRSLTLPTAFQTPEFLRRLERVLSEMRGDVEAAGGDVSVTMACLARLLRQIRGKRSTVTLRTLRHQYRANAALRERDAAWIAAAMGHASADSQQSYGRKRRGWRSMPLAAPEQELVARVRLGASTMSKIRCGAPLTRREALGRSHHHCVGR